MSRMRFVVMVAVAVVVTVMPASRRAARAEKPEVVELNLTPSSAQLAACMPDARVNVTVRLTTDVRGFDVFHVQGTGLPPNATFTAFLIEQAGPPLWRCRVHRRLHIRRPRRGRQHLQADR